MLYNVLSIVLNIATIVVAILFFILAPLMAVLVARSIREEMALYKMRKSVGRGDVVSHRRSRKNKKAPYVCRHRAETPVEKAKRELREEKERQARADSFFDHYYLTGDITGLEHPEAPHPAYNLPTDEARRFGRLMDKIDNDAKDDQAMKVMNEGL